ncbi:MAG: hypothetical protein HOH95_11635 [Dehalococcoidia bacterium]|jgi:hypothetical protein|nr:hypothetical protein [Chloroflexota bacterium]MBT5775015.1 hypothetical protein [Dehalococcoidia bacterium]
MRLHSYVITRDYGFAPNPFHGYCTLCTCKPAIRNHAKVDDWVVGTGQKPAGRDGRLVFAMRVTETMTFNEYWTDPRFRVKRPNLSGSLKQAYGDNIYYEGGSGWHQANGHHSLEDGQPNPENVKKDTKADRVLVSDDFVYWGGSGPELPVRFRGSEGWPDIFAGRGHRNNIFPGEMVIELIAWIRARNEAGVLGEPLAWDPSSS